VASEITTFVYDGNGVRVKKIDPDDSVTYYVGGIYEVLSTTTGITKTSYYYAGAQRVAMRITAGVSTTVIYLHGDHLGSTSLTTSAGGQVVARVLYYPYGEERYTVGTLTTDYGYTGQRKNGYLDTYSMGARDYDPRLGRWLSADTIVPNPANPQSFNRFAYVQNNPLKYTDPSGHAEWIGLGGGEEELGDVGEDVDWAAWEAEWRADHQGDPTEQDRWNYLFTLHLGSNFTSLEDTRILRELLYVAGIRFASSSERRWTMEEMQAIYDGVKAMVDAFGGVGAFRQAVGNTTWFERVAGYKEDHWMIGVPPAPRLAELSESSGRILVYDVRVDMPIICGLGSVRVNPGTSRIDYATVVHELAHKWDYNNGWALSEGHESAVEGKGIGGNSRERFAHAIEYYVTGQQDKLAPGSLKYISELSPPLVVD
jgi:RHS repeat-associated protein